MNERLSVWTRQHATLMAMGVLAFMLERSSFPLLAIAGGSILGLLIRFRGSYTPNKGFGAGNILTLIRVTLALVLMAKNDLSLALTAAAIMIALLSDGLDGWIARKSGMASPFGEVFDQESDALLFLAICLLLIEDRQVGLWILLPASYRYLFILFCRSIKPTEKAIQGTWVTRAIGITSVMALAICLAPIVTDQGVYWTASAVTVLLSLSFLKSGFLLYRTSPTGGSDF